MQFSQGSAGMNQYAGNLQQPYPNKYQNVHSSQVGKKSINGAQGVYGSEGSSLRVGKERSDNRESSLNERQQQQRDSSNNGTNTFHP